MYVHCSCSCWKAIADRDRCSADDLRADRSRFDRFDRTFEPDCKTGCKGDCVCDCNSSVSRRSALTLTAPSASTLTLTTSEHCDDGEGLGEEEDEDSRGVVDDATEVWLASGWGTHCFCLCCCACFSFVPAIACAGIRFGDGFGPARGVFWLLQFRNTRSHTNRNKRSTYTTLTCVRSFRGVLACLMAHSACLCISSVDPEAHYARRTNGI